MPRFAFKAGDDYALKLSRLAAGSEEIAKRAIFAGAAIVTDELRNAIEALPEEKFRYLRGDQFTGVSKQHKKDLLASLGITPIMRDDRGDWNAKVGFDGYGKMPTAKHKQGLPNQLLARAIESGSSVRRKQPFVRKTVKATKPRAEDAMASSVEADIQKIMS